jgi:hypothetical protein
MSPLTVLILVALFLSCSEGGVDFPQVEGWTRTGDVRVYDADTLWEYIDGAAELFVEYDVQTCRTADLASEDLVVTVDIYDMGTPLNAFGIFSRERPEGGAPLPEATEAVVSPPYQALLLKGGTYAKVNVVEGELTAATGGALLEAIARTLPGEAAYPSQLELLPQEGRVAGSEGYQTQGFLGLSELTHCLYAEYSDEGGQRWQGFVVLPEAGSSLDSVWDGLAGEWESLEHDGETLLHREIPYRGLAGLRRTPQAILGVSDAADQAELIHRLERLTT